MPLNINVNGVIKKTTKLTQNVGGVLKNVTSHKINVGGVLKEVLSQESELLTSGTIVLIWTATGGALISSQDGEYVTATVSNSSTNVSATNTSRIYSNTFYAEAGTKITFKHSGNSPSGPLVAYLLASDNSTEPLSINSSGGTLTVSTTGYYYFVIVGCGVRGSSSGVSYGSTTVTNATFTFDGGVAYTEAGSILYIVWYANSTGTISEQAGETVKGTIYNSSTSGAYSYHSLYSSKFYIEAGKKITFTGSISPSGPFVAYLVDANGTATQIGSSLTVSTTGYYHLAIAGCGVTGSQSGSGPTSGTITATFSVT